MRQHVEFSSRAERDLKSVPRQSRKSVVSALESLETVPPAANLDIRPLTGRPGWFRLRVGDWRILYRPMSEYEASKLVLERGVLEGSPAIVVGRIVNRRDLHRVIRTLEVPEVD
jgi:mRNA interferase RelE/StbE